MTTEYNQSITDAIGGSANAAMSCRHAAFSSFIILLNLLLDNKLISKRNYNKAFKRISFEFQSGK